MSDLSHWHNFVVLMLPFGYTTVYFPCCCESHNSYSFTSFKSLLHEIHDSAEDLHSLISYLTDNKVLVEIVKIR